MVRRSVGHADPSQKLIETLDDTAIAGAVAFVTGADKP
jgi:hypothetical protein